MQNDLISRVRLRTEVDKLFWDDKVISPKTMAIMHRLIDEQPTAYDVEKVVAELGHLKEMTFTDCGKSYNRALGHAIEIVRNGGKEYRWQ